MAALLLTPYRFLYRFFMAEHKNLVQKRNGKNYKYLIKSRQCIHTLMGKHTNSIYASFTRTYCIGLLLERIHSTGSVR